MPSLTQLRLRLRLQHLQPQQRLRKTRRRRSVKHGLLVSIFLLLNPSRPLPRRAGRPQQTGRQRRLDLVRYVYIAPLMLVVLDAIRLHRTLRSLLRALHDSASKHPQQSQRRITVGSVQLHLPSLLTKKSSLDGRSEQSDLAYPWWCVLICLLCIQPIICSLSGCLRSWWFIAHLFPVKIAIRHIFV